MSNVYKVRIVNQKLPGWLLQKLMDLHSCPDNQYLVKVSDTNEMKPLIILLTYILDQNPRCKLEPVGIKHNDTETTCFRIDLPIAQKLCSF